MHSCTRHDSVAEQDTHAELLSVSKMGCQGLLDIPANKTAHNGSNLKITPANTTQPEAHVLGQEVPSAYLCA